MVNKINKVLVVLGGTSGEREISISTGKACVKALKQLGYKVFIHDPKKKSLNLIDKKKVDVIFNALHGKDGEDGVAQSYFEYLRIPYTHSGVICSYNAMNKSISKQIFKNNNIRTPKYFVIKKSYFNEKFLKNRIREKRIKFPVVAKPINEGSSIGVKICQNFSILFKSINLLLKKYDDLIIEKFIGGQEIQVAVLNNLSLGAIELKPKRQFYDYKAKYSKKANTEHIMPANLSKIKYNQVLKIAKIAHKSLGCRGVSRSDFKFYKNQFFLLETNTQPGMTSLSLVPEIARYKGISFKNLVRKILLDADLNK